MLDLITPGLRVVKELCQMITDLLTQIFHKSQDKSLMHGVAHTDQSYFRSGINFSFSFYIILS